MRTDEVQVFGITKPFRLRSLAQRDVGPMEMDTRDVPLFDMPPAAESMQPIFQFVMMPGQDEEKDEEAGERAVAEVGSKPFMNGDGRHEADGKSRQSPAGEPFAEPPALRIQPVEPAEDAKQTGFAIRRSRRCDRRSHRMLTILVV